MYIILINDIFFFCLNENDLFKTRGLQQKAIIHTNTLERWREPNKPFIITS